MTDLHAPGSLFHDPAYRRIVDEVAGNRLRFIEHLIERGDTDAAAEGTRSVRTRVPAGLRE